MQTGIIVADDDVMVRSLLRSVLMTLGYDVFTTSTGEEAVAVASRMRASLILLDLNMPKLNGLLACERLRALPDYSEIPIIILSAYDSVEARAASSRMGSTLFLAKPFQPSTLLAVLGRYLKDPGSRQRDSLEGDGGNATVQRGHALDRGKSILDVYRGNGEVH